MSTRPNREQIAAAAVGNALDWYDFTLFGYMATIISAQLFPPGEGWRSLFSTFTVFAISFFIRPFGGIVVGYGTDVFGRRAMLLLIIAAMSAGSAIIGLSPNYATAGILSPMLVLGARFLQGLGAGGEFAAATSFLVENAPPGSQGLYGGWQLSGQGIAIAAAALLSGLTSYGLTPQQFAQWGWRVPFLFGLLIVPVGIYLRMRATEPGGFVRQNFSSYKSAAVSGVIDNKLRLLIALGLVVGGTAAFYGLLIFMPTYALRVLELDARSSFIGPIVGGIVIAVLCPLMGALSDRVGRKPLLLAGAAGSIVALYPAFAWLQSHPSLARLLIVESVFGLCISVYGGPFSTAIAELFPAAIRATAMSIAYNVGVALFGGLAPLVVAWLIARTGNPLAPAYYVTGCMMLSFIAAASLPSTPKTH